MTYRKLLRPIIFFFNDTATTEIYTLSLHDALPISSVSRSKRRREVVTIHRHSRSRSGQRSTSTTRAYQEDIESRSEEHTYELQSRSVIVYSLMLESKGLSLRRRRSSHRSSSSTNSQ